MLFNSYAFIFLFLPVSLAGFYILAPLHHRAAKAYLVMASLFFYGWWNPIYLPLMMCSIMFNFFAGAAIQRTRSKSGASKKPAAMLVSALAANLLLLAYYKYAAFLINNLSVFHTLHFNGNNITLPLGISFFTFTQIAYLVDVYRSDVQEYNLLNYFLFVTWFPHLIAGPILHHQEMMPQFASLKQAKIKWNHLAPGFTIFTIGLFKKTVVADNLATYVSLIYDAADKGIKIGFFESWIGAFAYSFQLYFDFSAYSDMAIGLSLLFNVKMPLNFFSPYKAQNIIEFWRRWHITLSRFLRDYVYIPLGGNRRGEFSRYLNIMITMLVGGLWHGANWTFVAWGGVHGCFLLANHAYRKFQQNTETSNFVLGQKWAGITLTFISVTAAWVLFKSNTFETAGNMLAGMSGLHGISLPGRLLSFIGKDGFFFENGIVTFSGVFPNHLGLQAEAFYWLTFSLCIIWFFPNIAQVMQKIRPTLSSPMDYIPYHGFTWEPAIKWALVVGVIWGIAIAQIETSSDFIYFKF